MSKSIFLQVGVKIFLKNRDGKYLLLRRSQTVYPQLKNQWDIPGGRIIPGTSLSENLQREVSEETKLKIIGIPTLLYAQDIIRGKEKHIVRLSFKGRAEGEPVLNEEHTEYLWCSIREMKKIPELDEFTREVIEKDLIK